MADGFKIADAYVSVLADIDDRSVERSAMTAGDRAGTAIGREASKSAGRTYERDATGRFKGISDRVGKSSGDSLGDGFKSKRGIFSKIGGLFGGDMSSGLGGSLKSGGTAALGGLRAAFLNPYVLGGVALIGAGVAPALMAGISGAIIGGAGLGVIGLGFALVKEEPAVKKAGEKLTKTLQSTFKAAAKPLIGPFVEAIGIITKTVKDLGPTFGQMFKAVAPAIVPLTKGFMDLVKNAMPGILKLVEASGPFLTTIAPAFGKIGTGISIFSREIAKAGPDAAVFFNDLLTWIGGIIAGFGYMIGWVARGYGEFRKFWISVGPWVANAWNAVSNWFSSVGAWFSNIGSKIAGGYNAFINFFKGIGSAVSSWVSSVIAWFGALPGRIGGFFSSIWATISGWGTNVGTFFASLPGKIGAFLAALPGVLVNAFKTALSSALFAVGYAIGSIIKFFIEFPGKARAALSSLWSAISGAFNSAKTNAINAGTALVNGVINFFRTLPGKARSAVSSLWSNMVSYFTSAKTNATNLANQLVTSAVNFLRGLPGKARSAVASLWSSMSGAFSSARSAAASAASSLVNGAVNYLRSLPGKARSAVSGVKSSITGAFSGAASWLYSAGQNIMRGLANGIKAAVGAAIGAAKSAVGSVISGAKSALGIGSPSKVARDQVGRWFMPGVAVGVEKGIPAARKRIAAAVTAVVPGAVSGGGGRVGPAYTSAAGTTYQFAAGSVVLDASKLRTIQDVIELIGGISRTSRTAYASR